MVEEMLNEAIRAHRAFLRPLAISAARSWRSRARAGKVGLVIGGRSGHEPCLPGYVGKGLADAVAVGNSSRPRRPIRSSNARRRSGAAPAFSSSTGTMSAT